MTHLPQWEKKVHFVVQNNTYQIIIIDLEILVLKKTLLKFRKELSIPFVVDGFLKINKQ